MKITIIGAGPGGYTAAFAAARAGAEVTLVESAHLGGTCLNTGCIPTKSFRASADVFEAVRNAHTFGLAPGLNPEVHMPELVLRKRRITETLREGIRKGCARLGVQVLQGRGQVCNATRTLVTAADGSTQEVPGDRIILATGSVPLQLPNLPVDHKHVLTSDDVLELDHIPQRVIVVGGGVIGMELAFILQALGTAVTVVEGQNRVLPLPSLDADLSDLMRREMKKRRIGLELERTVREVCVDNGQVLATLAPADASAPVAEKQLTADMLVVAVGRAPNTQGLGLAEAGILLNRRGFVCVDDRLETSLPGVFAIGDLLGPERIMLAHMAAAEGKIAAENCMGGKRNVDYTAVPSAIFTTPEVAAVGLTEAQAREAGHEVVCPVFQFRELGKAQAMGELPGFFKLVAEAGTGTLLGAHIAGAHATDLIAECTLALRLKATLHDLAETIHAHPTLAEGIFEAAAEGCFLNAPGDKA